MVKSVRGSIEELARGSMEHTCSHVDSRARCEGKGQALCL